MINIAMRFGTIANSETQPIGDRVNREGEVKD